MQHVSLVTEKLKKRDERMLPLLLPKNRFHLHSSSRRFIVLIVTVVENDVLMYVKKELSLRKGIDVCLGTQAFLGLHCSIPACLFKFYVNLSVGKQWPQTKGQ